MTSPHWIETPHLNDENQHSVTTDLPIWSVGTFSVDDKLEEDKFDEQQQHNANPENSNQPISVESPTSPAQTKAKITPKRAAPAPPKGKKKKKEQKDHLKPTPAEYAVPISSWFGKKKTQNSPYKELNLSQLQAPNPYDKPTV